MGLWEHEESGSARLRICEIIAAPFFQFITGFYEAKAALSATNLKREYAALALSAAPHNLLR
jgi:hypothetical protein